MKCIIFTTNAAHTDSTTTPLLPLCSLVDRPFLQHLVEVLVESGVVDLHVISESHSERVESLLGDGTRWGIRVHHHLTVPGQTAYDAAGTIPGINSTEMLMLADACAIVPTGPLAAALTAGDPVLFTRALKPASWTGWAILPFQMLKNHSAAANRDQLYAALRQESCFHRSLRRVGSLDAETHAELLESNRRILTAAVPGMHLLGRAEQNGIRFGPGVRVHPDASIVGPCYLGAGVEVDAGCVIGPNATIGSGTIIDKDTKIRNSIVEPDLYVGTALELDGHHVCAGLLYDITLETPVPIGDATVIDTLARPWAENSVRSILGRVAAVGLLALFSPLIAALEIRSQWSGKCVLDSAEYVLTPHSAGTTGWKSVPLHRFSQFSKTALESVFGNGTRLTVAVERLIPGALDVLFGRLRWVGTQPRNIQEMMDVPAKDRATLLTAPAGVFSEADWLQRCSVANGRHLTALEVATPADLHYIAAHSLTRDLSLVHASLFAATDGPDGYARAHVLAH